jgi:hypothetical protein
MTLLCKNGKNMPSNLDALDEDFFSKHQQSARIAEKKGFAGDSYAGMSTPERFAAAKSDGFNDATLKFATPFGTINTPIPMPGAEKFAALGGGLTSFGRGIGGLFTGGKMEGKEEFDAAQKALEQGSWGNKLMAMGGEALPTMAIPGLGAGGLAARMAKMGAAGAGAGFAGTEGGASDRISAGVLGGTVGAAMPGLGFAAKEGFNAALPFLGKYGTSKLAGRELVKNLGGNDAARTVAGEMDNATELLLGSKPTASQAVLSPNARPYFSAMEKTLSAKEGLLRPGKPGLNARATEQNKAITDITDQKSAGLLGDIADREAKVAPMYENATLNPNAHAPYVKGQTKKLMESPQYLQAVKFANENLFTGKGKIPQDLADPRYLQLVKKGFDNQLETVTATTAPAINAAKEAFMTLSGHISPDLKAARQEFAKMSVPINQKQIWQTLDDKLTPSLSDFGAEGKSVPAVFKSAMADMDKTAQKATKFKKSKADEILDPQDMGLLSDIGSDVARRENAAQAAKGFPSSMFDNYSMSNLTGKTFLPNSGGKLGLIPSMGKFVYGGADNEVSKLLIEKSLDPKAMAELIRKAAGKDPAAMKKLKSLSRGIGGGLSDNLGLLSVPYGTDLFDN